MTAVRDCIGDHAGATKQDLGTTVVPDQLPGYDAALDGSDAGERYRGAWGHRVVILSAVPSRN